MTGEIKHICLDVAAADVSARGGLIPVSALGLDFVDDDELRKCAVYALHDLWPL